MPFVCLEAFHVRNWHQPRLEDDVNGAEFPCQSIDTGGDGGFIHHFDGNGCAARCMDLILQVH
jgi:hypothetical protein